MCFKHLFFWLTFVSLQTYYKFHKFGSSFPLKWRVLKEKICICYSSQLYFNVLYGVTQQHIYKNCPQFIFGLFMEIFRPKIKWFDPLWWGSLISRQPRVLAHLLWCHDVSLVSCRQNVWENLEQLPDRPTVRLIKWRHIFTRMALMSEQSCCRTEERERGEKPRNFLI